MKALLLTFIACVALIFSFSPRAHADVVITRFEPPLAVVVPDEDDFWVIRGMVFGGATNVFLGWGIEEMDVGFFAPGQIYILPEPLPAGRTNMYGGAATLPFGTSIGSNVVSTTFTRNGAWYGGDVVTGGDISFGDRIDGLGYVVSDVTVGDPPVIAGYQAGKEGVIALQIYFNGQPHFGYIHFDFRYIYSIAPGAGFGGYVFGYAYETQPGTPIIAQRLRDSAPASGTDGLITAFNPVSGFVLTWNAVSGGTYRVQSSFDLLKWIDASGDIVASQNSVTYTIPAPAVSQQFYRIRRIN